MYKKGAVVILTAKEEDLPVFGLVQHVIAVEVDSYFFIVLVLHTICFRPHFHAYEIEYPSSPNYTVVKPSDLVDHHPVGLYTCTFSNQSLQVVSLKYHVISK